MGRTNTTSYSSLRFFLDFLYGVECSPNKTGVKGLLYRVPQCLSTSLNGGDTLACGEGGGGAKFRRLDRHCGTLSSNHFTRQGQEIIKEDLGVLYCTLSYFAQEYSS
jgi:hypothetical protein